MDAILPAKFIKASVYQTIMSIENKSMLSLPNEYKLLLQTFDI